MMGFDCYLSALLMALSGMFSPVGFAALEEGSRPQTVTAVGELVGIVEQGAVHYLGIPYAQPPTGALRWRPPQPLRPWQGLREAREFGPDCPQQRRSPTMRVSSEDCLTLNVSAPRTASAKAKLPVMVKIHGGGFVAGSGATDHDTVAEWVNREGIVLVSFNYRLGLLGFFAHPGLVQTQTQPIANFGLLDMVAALQWVQDNIAAFGGDASRITIVGVSAGGMAVQSLMVMPQAKGLFQRAIAQSGYGTWPLPRTGTASTSQRLSSAAALSTRLVDPLMERQAVTAQSLRALPTQQLVDAIRGFHLPMVDGVSLPEEPGVMFAQGKQHRVDFLTGGNSFEGSVYPDAGISTAALMALFGDQQGQAQVLYQDDFAQSSEQGLSRLFGDFRYVFASAYLAAQAGGRQPTYLYYMDMMTSAIGQRWPGSPHGMTSVMLFGSDRIRHKLGVSEHLIGPILRRYWLNFIKSGNPNGEGLPHWPRVTRSSRPWLVFAEAISVRQDVLAAKLAWLASVYQQQVDAMEPVYQPIM